MGATRKLSDCVRSFLSWLELRAKSGTVRFYRMYLERLVHHLDDKPVAEVRKIDITGWAADRNPLICACRFFRWCVDEAEYLDESPTAKIKPPKCGRRRRTLNRRERVTIRRMIGRAFRDSILAIEESGCRPDEMRTVGWTHIKPTTWRVHGAHRLASGRYWFELEEFKARERREDRSATRKIVITRRLGRLLARLWASRPGSSGPIFVGPSGRSWTSNALRCAFRRLRASLEGSEIVKPAGLVAYVYRHTKATALARKGMSAHLLKEWLGHAKVETAAVYCHFAMRDLLRWGRRRRRPPRMNR